MLEFYKQIFDVPIHADAASFARIVPFDVNTRKLVSSHVELDPMIFFEKIEEVVEVVDPDIFDPKVVHNQQSGRTELGAICAAKVLEWMLLHNTLRRQGASGGDRLLVSRPGEGHSSLGVFRNKSSHRGHARPVCIPR